MNGVHGRGLWEWAGCLDKMPGCSRVDNEMMRWDDSSIVGYVMVIVLITTAPYMSSAGWFAFLVSPHIVVACRLTAMIGSWEFAIHGIVIFVYQISVCVTIATLIAFLLFCFCLGFHSSLRSFNSFFTSLMSFKRAVLLASVDADRVDRAV